MLNDETNMSSYNHIAHCQQICHIIFADISILEAGFCFYVWCSFLKGLMLRIARKDLVKLRDLPLCLPFFPPNSRLKWKKMVVILF